MGCCRTQSRSVEWDLEEGMLTSGRWFTVGKGLRPRSMGQIIIRKPLKREFRHRSGDNRKSLKGFKWEMT